MHGATDDFLKMQKEFRSSIRVYKKDHRDIEAMMDCRDIRRLARNALGGACITSNNIRGTVFVAFLFMGCSILLFLLAVATFMEGIIDKTTIRKYMEVEMRRLNTFTLDSRDT